ncbi:MAG: hypothetical protein WEA10_09615 [Actinomycetota bacterium]
MIRFASRSFRTIAAMLVVGALLMACTGDDDPAHDPSAGASTSDLVAIVASADLVAEQPQRLDVGLLTSDNRFLSYGDVEFSFSYLGTETDPVDPEPSGTATARFVPTPGEQIDDREAPEIVPPSEARGVYEAGDVTFDRAGFWRVEVSGALANGGSVTASADFGVNDRATLPYPGEKALKTENHVVGEKGVPDAAIDSRATTEGEVPDRALHEWTIAGAVDQGIPALVLFATPVYCETEFCGPVTDELAALQREFGDRAAYIHVEIWRDFQATTLNEAAADWLYRDGQLTEPWLYLIGADGKILDRWGPLFDPAEVEEALAKLPKLPAGTRPS